MPITLEDLYSIIQPKSKIEIYQLRASDENIAEYRLLKQCACLNPESLSALLEDFGKIEVQEVLWYPTCMCILIKEREGAL